MSEEYERNEEQFASVLEQYEAMIKDNRVEFFDLEQFEEIFDHYYAKNKISKAEKVLSIAQDQHPYSSELKMRHAQILMRRKKFEKAIDLLEKLLHLEPNNPDLYLLMAEACSDKGEMDKAVECYLSALQFMDKEEHDYVYMDIAGEYLSHSNYQKALDYLEIALDVNPYNDLIYLDILFATQVLEEVGHAYKLYQKQIEKDAYNQIAWFYSGIALSDMDRIEEAIEAFDFAIVIDGGFTEAYFQKAELYMSKDNYVQAINVLSELGEDIRHNASANYMLGECYENLSQWTDALKYYRNAAQLDPNFSDAWLSIGVITYKLGSFEEALSYVKKSLRLEPNNVDAFITLGDIKKDTGQYDAAFDAYKRAESIDNTVIDLWLNYSDLYVQTGDLESALAMMEEAVKVLGEIPELYYRYGAYEYLNGSYLTAYALIEMAAQMNVEMIHKELFTYLPELRNNSEIQNIILRIITDEN